jgi:hypothetical protein
MDAMLLAQSLAAILSTSLPARDDEIRSALGDRKVPIAANELELTIAADSVNVVGARAVPQGLEVRIAVAGSARVDVR